MQFKICNAEKKKKVAIFECVECAGNSGNCQNWNRIPKILVKYVELQEYVKCMMSCMWMSTSIHPLGWDKEHKKKVISTLLCMISS